MSSEKTTTNKEDADKARKEAAAEQPLREDAETSRRLKRYSKKRRGGVLRYPLEALTEHTDYLQIDIEEYVALGNYVSEPGSSQRYVLGNYRTNRAGRTRTPRLSKKPLVNNGTILLPIPSQIQDTNNVQFDDSTINGLTAVGVQAAEGFMNIDLGQNVSVSYTHLTLPTILLV